MAGVAQERFRGFAYKLAGGSYVNPKAYRNVNFAFNEAALERDHHWDQFGSPYAPDPGAQSVDGGFELDIHADSYTDQKDLLSGAIGEEEAASALTWDSGGTNDATQFAFSGGTPAPFAKIVSGGSTFYLPVDASAAGQATLGVELPSGGAATAASNPSDESGGAFNQLLGDAAQDYVVEVDRRKRPLEEVYNATTISIYEALFMFELGKRLAIAYKMRGGAFTRPAPPSSNITDPTKYSNPFISFLGDILLAPASPTPAIDDGFTRVKKLSFGLAPDVLAETGSKGLDGGTSAAGSDILAYTRMAFAPVVSILLTYPPGDDTYYTAWRAGTAYKLFGVHIPGAPGATSPAANRFMYYWPRLVQSMKPQEVIDGGQVCLQTTWMAERQTGRDWNSLFHVGFFNS